MFDIITFGSAARDIFLRAKQFLIDDFKIDRFKKEILLPLGLKIDIKDVHFHSGGGGTNTAATFSTQGLKVAFCGVIGRDSEGEEILKELRKKGIETKFIFRANKKPTNLSVIFSTPRERTILVYRGASQLLNKNQIPWSKIKETRWLYLAPLSKKLTKLSKELVDFAKKNQIKVMANPGDSQLNLSKRILYPTLKKIDILLLNLYEAQMLAENFSLKGKNLISKIKRFFPGILIITNGEEEVLASNGEFFYSALPPKIKIVDKTGAGDAFGAGFLSGYIKSGGDIKFSIQLATANAVSCLKKWGAKEGILKKNQNFKKVKVKVYEES